MKIRIEDLKDSQKLIKIEVEAERVISVLDDIYGQIQKKAHVQGFRPGKAPRDIIEKHHEDTARSEMIDRLAWDCYREAVIQEKLEPVGYPVMEDISFNKGAPLIFAVKVDISPEFKLKSYKGIKMKEEPAIVTDEDVGLALKQVQESLAQYKNIEGRPVATGDYVVCDYECLVDGKLVDKKDKLWLYISDQIQPKEMLDALLGSEKGATKEFEVTHPDNYQYKPLAGKKALYRITPREVKNKVLADINDDLAKEAGNFTGLDDLKKQLRDNILQEKKGQARHNKEDQIFDYLLKAHPFEVPLSMVERQLAHLIEDAKMRLLYQGYKKEDLDKEDENLKGALKEKARESVRLFFIIKAIAKQENIGAKEDDIEERVKEISQHTKKGPKEVRESLEKKGLMDELKEQIIHGRVLEFLVSEAKKS